MKRHRRPLQAVLEAVVAFVLVVMSVVGTGSITVPAPTCSHTRHPPRLPTTSGAASVPATSQPLPYQWGPGTHRRAR